MVQAVQFVAAGARRARVRATTSPRARGQRRGVKRRAATPCEEHNSDRVD